MSQEKYPISERLTVLEGETLYRSDKWWAAVLLLESFGRRQVAFYLWQNKGGAWKRNQKFALRTAAEWAQIKNIVERLLPQLRSTGQSPGA